MSFNRNLLLGFSRILQCALMPLGATRRDRARAVLAADLVPDITVSLAGGKSLRFHCPNELTCWRAQTFFDKEPETLRWIDGFAEGAVLWDIGANVGLYSLYAAARGTKVWAFEPSAANYACLNRNQALNGLQVHALCLALSDTTKVGSLQLSGPEIGAALHQLTLEQAGSVDDLHQSVLSVRPDDLVEMLDVPPPDHIKIDVDGLEFSILRGAAGLLRQPSLRSILVELDQSDTDAYQQAVGLLESSGFRLAEKARAPMNDSPANASIYNHVFVRS